MVPVWAHAVKKVNEELPKDKIPLLGVGAAFSFLGMMFNVPSWEVQQGMQWEER